MQLVRCQTAQILAIESIMARQTGGRMKCAAIKQLTPEQVSALGFESDVSLAIESNRAVSQVLQQQILMLEKRLHECVKLRPDYHLLKIVPGIGDILATVTMLEIGSVSRFAQICNFSSDCRCVAALRESNGRQGSRRLSRHA